MDVDESKSSIVDRLHDHVFGLEGPTQSLLNEGRLPTGWASEYLSLLRIATKQWVHELLWPRRLVAAIHFTSWYLNLRYEAWRISHDRNENTERELASLRSASELFLMQGSHRQVEPPPL
ncbi:MAG: hypothetical protein Fues2KO_29310 [Fuerstiella sp.]